LTCALLQPVLDPSTDGTMAVLVALNKEEWDVADGAFDEASFSRSDRWAGVEGAVWNGLASRGRARMLGSTEQRLGGGRCRARLFLASAFCRPAAG
jgi:hypothetical protein